jgi:enoyl-CoA hydratase/carnithine racemase
MTVHGRVLNGSVGDGTAISDQYDRRPAATVVFNNPPANALSSPVMTELEGLFHQLRD